ncbi:MAG: hypothetical protein K2O01_02035, partial [Bacteroidales bacterium]|nr:hypothetical protein [Bacteroidales bacterium]
MTKYCNISTNRHADALRAFYRKLCDSPQGAGIPLFAQAWWLDTVCPDAWTVLTYPAGATPTDTASAAGWPTAAMPVHTPYADTVRPPFLSQQPAIWL